MEPSFWQREAQGAGFDPDGEYIRRRERQLAEESRQRLAGGLPVDHDPLPPPRATDAQYNPHHPEADWSGLVAAPRRRKILRGRARETSILPGMVPEHSTDEKVQHSRKHFERDYCFRSAEPGAEATPFGTAAYQQGPGTSHTAQTWRSSTQAQMLGEQEAEAPTYDRHVERRHVEAPFEKGSESRAGVWPTGGARVSPVVARSSSLFPTSIGPGRSGPTSMLAGIGSHIAGASFTNSFYQRLDARKRTTAHAPAAVAPPGYGGHRPVSAEDTPTSSSAFPGLASPPHRDRR